ncbi:cytosolic protein [Salinibacillus xinjiangensis]|uniref:Cytosolic protein n=1 Tax=Salinibacillus xinjiangensis TaxID=1229268 RepID=A0A6G1X2G0_9BACI|nr:cytosolic protein [Salinibacillus xinjiangensis]MRG85173.1 cytosolic protein [Salinibacillus xinjiangensis]
MAKNNKREHVKANYDDFATVEVQQKYAFPEEMPDGPYGSPIASDEIVQNKEAVEGQRHYTPFNYENKGLHEDLPRQYPGAHPPHDEPDKDIKPPEDNQ